MVIISMLAIHCRHLAMLMYIDFKVILSFDGYSRIFKMNLNEFIPLYMPFRFYKYD